MSELQQPQPQQQNNHDCSWVETKLSQGTPTHPPTTATTNSKLHDRAEIEQNNKVSVQICFVSIHETLFSRTLGRK